MKDAAKTKKQLIGELVELRQRIDQIKRASEGGYKLGGQEQHEAHILLRAIIEGTTDAVFIKDLRGRYVMANSATANFLGKPLEEITRLWRVLQFCGACANQVSP